MRYRFKQLATRLSLALGLSACLVGCIQSPSPLNPNFSGSIGVPHQGVQTGAAELPRRGPGFERYRPGSPTYFGQPRLVNALMRAAAKVDTEFPGGHPMVVGDLSAEQGGQIPRHRSHRTGRDVDLLWYVTTPGGAPVRNPGFIHINSDGLALVDGVFYALDLPRQWALIKALLLDEEAGVQWMFMSQPIEALLVDYARSRGEPDDLVWYAETVMHQPRDSANHDDHIHMRVACTFAELSRGCLGGGPYWEFLKHPPLPSFSDEELFAMAASEPTLTEAGVSEASLSARLPPTGRWLTQQPPKSASPAGALSGHALSEWLSGGQPSPLTGITYAEFLLSSQATPRSHEQR